MMARKILPLIEEFHYSVNPGRELDDFLLTPPDTRHPKLHFKVIRDDLTRGVWFESGKGDVLFDTLSLSKTAHFRTSGSQVLTATGHHFSYLGFNLKHPVLALLKVRRAIQKAIPIQEWIQEKYFGFVEPLPSTQQKLDIPAANSDLDQAGFPVQPDGFRFTLRYLTTPVREGNEMALLTREALKRIFIRIEVVPLETSLFFSRLNRRDFELFGSRIPRSTPDEPIQDFFKSGGRRNYFSYSNLGVDDFLALHPQANLDAVLPELIRDLPLIPLFTWRHGLLLSPRVVLQGIDFRAMDDSFRFLRGLLLN